MTLLDRLRTTPLHPQWFACYREGSYVRAICSGLAGTVLDIGCADGKPCRHLPTESTYIGLDYLPTASEWYDTQPDLYGDAQQLPLADASVDHVLLLDVLEHLRAPDEGLGEIHRVLVRGGTLTMQVPFIYPIHDAPRDYRRWTRHGLTEAAARHGFSVQSEEAVGHPIETAALLANIASSKTVLNWMRRKNPLALLVLLLPFVVVARNCLAWLGARLSRADDMMPYAYRVVWVRN